jgi:alpha-1,6-mannosyltransferase
VGSRVRAAHREVRGVGSTLKVLDLTEFYSPAGGGVRTYLHEKIHWLADQAAFDHVVVTPGPRDDTRRIERTVVHQLGGPPAPGSPGYHVLWSPRALDGILRRERPDIVELGSPYLAPWLLRWARRHVSARTVGFLHMDLVGAAGRSVPRAAGRFASSVSAWYVRRAYAACDRLVATSRAMHAAALDAGLPDPAVVPLGVDLGLFRPERRSVEWRRERMGDGDDPIGLYVGRLAGEKDLEALISAIPELYRHTGMKTVLIGEGRLRSRLEAMQQRTPDAVEVLRFEADRDRLATAYASADVFLAPCTHETFGLAVLEAAASGLPVVGSSEGGVGEMLTGAPWGSTFAHDDVERLLAGVKDVLSRDAEAMRASARAFAETHSWNNTFERLATVYEELTQP